MTMGTLKKKIETRTQKEWAMEQLLAGKTLSQIDMLMDYGIGHHCEVIRRCRAEFEKMGLPRDYIKTDFVSIISRRTGRRIRFAVYSIPSIKKNA